MGFEDDFKGKFIPDTPPTSGDRAIKALQELYALTSPHKHTESCYSRSSEGCGEHHVCSGSCFVRYDCKYKAPTVPQIRRLVSKALD